MHSARRLEETCVIAEGWSEAKYLGVSLRYGTYLPSIEKVG